MPDVLDLETGDAGRSARGVDGSSRPDERGQVGPGRVEPGQVEVAPLIRSKIQAPALRSSTLSRQRLLDRLADAVAARVTLVTAEAGYGKTTLLADFAAHAGLRTLWYRLDSTDADHVTWTNYLIAAGREVAPDFGRATLSLLAQLPTGGPPKSAYMASLIGELPQLGEGPTLLVLDDFHLVDANADVRELVGRLVEQAPDWLHLVISSRRRPSLEFARLAGMGELTELNTDELRFSPSETERLFADGYEQPLEADVLRDLDRRTRGWAASLQLFHGSIRGRPAAAVRALARSLSGAKGPIYDFLAEEVLANIPADLADFLVRAALLERVLAAHMVALLADSSRPRTVAEARSWIEDADRMGLLTRTSETSEARQLHPLLRDFLIGQLEQRFDADDIKQMHLRLARTISDSDPLTACRHFIEGGEHGEAMGCLGASVMLTMGSGQWGVASELIDRLEGVPADPAVAAIRARRLIEDGDLTGAERLLLGTDISASPPDVRAVLRQTTLSLGWRTGDPKLLHVTLREIEADPETPAILHDIAQVFVDASWMAGTPTALPVLGRRLVAMARTQQEAGHDFYCAISLHNATVAYLNAGDYEAALGAAQDAMRAFDALSFAAPERLSTESLVTICRLETGESLGPLDHQLGAGATPKEFADVPAELAVACLVLGERQQALELISRAETRHREGRSDVLGVAITEVAKALADLPSHPALAVGLLQTPTFEGPLDLGHTLARKAVLAQSHLLGGDPESCLTVAEPALEEARLRCARRAETRLALLVALARRDPEKLRLAIGEANSSGRLALLELADPICDALDLLIPLPTSLEASIASSPKRWLPALRRQLDRGDVLAGHVAAQLLDGHGEFIDVGRLRAYAKTYRRRGASSAVGVELARRTSPRLRVHDLGRVTLDVGGRVVALSGMRRKPASLLMYLVTRPQFTANREQVLDVLWPDADPASSSNSLNQSLYFLRREIDPWYEDDVAAGYVGFEGDVVWLDQALTSADSVDFLAAARLPREPAALPDILRLIRMYFGHFAPEFEYEEWAINWRSRLHSTLLDLANSSVDALVRAGNLAGARDVAIASLAIDPAASDIERRLIWLYWQLGATSAARAQHQHLARREESDGLEPTSLVDIVAGPAPRAGG